MDREQWEVAPYTEADLTRQAEQLDDALGPVGAQIQRDVQKYQEPTERAAPGGVARPDPGSLERHEVVAARTGATPPAGTGLRLPTTASNALLISGRESASGHPLFVAGPQLAYFNPQILMEEDVHAPPSGGQPGIDATGASFVGINLYVQLGRGRDYSWSATSAGQDNIDTFAVDLCRDDTHYMSAASAWRWSRSR
jgi:acyl-homoserine lactone acylase PvdQ